ncbi:MAG: hypothetical protein M3361_04805 [Candidatus Tectomicrobia bacterium]|nr:hypothetical protein [Candidatus Tectomicrobia bacterium]
METLTYGFELEARSGDIPVDYNGEIVVEGPVVTRAYYRRERATALAEIPDGKSW